MNKKSKTKFHASLYRLKKKIVRIQLKYLFLICFALVMSVWTVRLLDLHYGSANLPAGALYVSDAVAQQVILNEWQEGYSDQAFMGKDSWFIKFPLYVFTNNLPVSPPWRIYITSWLILLATAFLILISIKRFLKSLNTSEDRRKLSLLATSIFLAAIPSTAFFLFQFPNSRNIEIGLFLFLLVEIHRLFILKDSYKNRKILKLSALFLASIVLIANDPMFLYLFAIPIVLFCCAYLVFCRRDQYSKVAKLLGMTCIAVVAAKVLAYLLTVILPIAYVEHFSKVATFEVFLLNIKTLFNNAINVLGINLWGNSFTDINILIAGIFMLILVVAAYGLVAKATRYRASPTYGLPAFLAVFTIIVFCIGINSSIGIDMLSGRYLILLGPLEILGLAYALVYIKNMRLIALIFVCLFGILSATLISNWYAINEKRHTQVNRLDRYPLDVIEENHLSKGYAAYSRATTLTYSSNFNVHVVSSECSLQDRQMYFSSVLTEKASLRRPSDKSFYLYDPLRPYDCKPDDLRLVLGDPKKVIPLPTGEILNIYDYDIAPKIKR